MTKPFKQGDIVGIHEVIECLTPNLAPWKRLYKVRCTLCGTIQTHLLNKRDRNTCKCNIVRTATKHGGITEKLYTNYRAMKARCYEPSYHHYDRYGGRGISVCPEWRESYSSFREWAYKTGYKPGLSLDRINNDGNYEPSNCRWVTQKEQVRNSTRVIKTDTGKCLTSLEESNNMKAIREYGLKVWSNLVKKRANGKCELCGKEGTDAHHWYFTRAQHSLSDIQPSNGVFLCRMCHNKAHNAPTEYKEKIKKAKGAKFNNLVEAALLKNRATISTAKDYTRVIRTMLRELKEQILI